MLELMRLEMRKINLKSYYFGSLAVCLVALAFGGMFMAIGHFQGGFGSELDQMGSQAGKLSSLDFAVLMVMVFLLVGFSILGAALCGVVILKPYSGRSLVLTLSYPVRRSRLLIAKMLAVSSVTIRLFLTSSIYTLAIFIGANQMLGALSAGHWLHTLSRCLLLLALSALGLLGIMGISLALGFRWRSVPVMIGVLIVLDSLIGNTFSASMQLASVFLAAVFLLSLPAIGALSRTITHIQVP
ncbi:hypothetical protein KIMH_11730 [Bombiscardovia apis]|uniref:ABC transporter permease n=1 Tax=Bombiscardovia apis TaxID=2932182 RepID=A0ABN6SGC6_9BIFI|nr:hypothetical protein [Bombiscardovia apis]BDR55062.1 hypothetical protein KIMH_11730 [Bombiscardovia apis]